MFGPSPAPNPCGIAIKAGDGLYSGHTLSSSVQHLETKSPLHPGEWIRATPTGNPDFDCQPISLDDSRARHRSFAVRRWKIWESLNRLHAPGKRLNAYANCGSGAWLQSNDAGDELRVVSNHCHDRWCCACGGERAKRIYANLRDKVKLTHCRFFTFTLRHSRTPLADQIDRLYRSFAVLRRRREFRDHVTGGVAFFEGKISEKDGLWHPHLHVIAEGTFWHQRDISRAWHAVTGDSTIVHIRNISADDGTEKYVTKYVTKPADETVFADPDKLDEMVSALKGRRLFTTFARWRTWQLDAAPADASSWRSIAPLADLASRAKSGDSECRRFCAAAARKWPLLDAVYGWTAALASEPADSS